MFNKYIFDIIRIKEKIKLTDLIWIYENIEYRNIVNECINDIVLEDFYFNYVFNYNNLRCNYRFADKNLNNDRRIFILKFIFFLDSGVDITTCKNKQ